MNNANSIVLKSNNPCVITKVNKKSNHYLFKNFKVVTRFFIGLFILPKTIMLEKCMKIVVYKENSFDEIDTYRLEDEDILEFNNFEYEEIEWE